MARMVLAWLLLSDTTVIPVMTLVAMVMTSMLSKDIQLVERDDVLLTIDLVLMSHRLCQILRKACLEED